MEQLLLKVNEALNENFVGNYCFSDIELEDIYNNTNKLLRVLIIRSRHPIGSIYRHLRFGTWWCRPLQKIGDKRRKGAPQYIHVSVKVNGRM